MSYRYFENRDCAYYPCHAAEHINCLFCFCPLYQNPACGGDFVLIDDGAGGKRKDCSPCLRPHEADGYDYVLAHLNGVLPKEPENPPKESENLPKEPKNLLKR